MHPDADGGFGTEMDDASQPESTFLKAEKLQG
jgi:hypothetical protein